MKMRSLKWKHALVLTLLLSVGGNCFAKDKVTPKKLTLLQCFNLQKSLKYGHRGEIDKAVEIEEIAQTHAKIQGLEYSGVVPWSPKRREVVRRVAIEKLEMDSLAATLPVYDKAQKVGPGRAKVNDIRWSQMAANNVSQDGKYTVVGNALDIKSGKLDIKKLPTIRVWRDDKGRIWTLDHRRLAAIKLSGVIDEIDVEFVTEAIVKEQKFKFSNRDEGRTIFLYLDEKDALADKAIVLTNDGAK